MSGKCTRIKSKDIKHIIIPCFEGLSIKELMQFARKYSKVMKALPVVEKEIEKLPRQYIANIIYTLVEEPFYEWVEAQINIRNEKMADKMDVHIEMDPELVKVFKESTAVTSK